MNIVWGKVQRAAKQQGLLLTTSKYGGRVTSCQVVGLEYYRVVWSQKEDKFVAYSYARPAYTTEQFRQQMMEGVKVLKFLESI